MNKEKIANIIYNELAYMYCDNCRYSHEIDTDEDLWAYEYLTDALLGLEKWFEEAEEI